jgi:TM2 domain-containing membrane protein YozV
MSIKKSRNIATILALSGTLTPISGFHKFYVGQHWWGALYILLSWTPIPQVACAIEGVWYLAQGEADFDRHFNSGQTSAIKSSVAEINHVGAIADAVRQLDLLREEGLISEYEFEQKRRQMLDRIA